MNLTIGKHYFIRRTKRTDQFAHKRYTTPELIEHKSLVVMGRLVEYQGNEVKLLLTDNNGFFNDNGEFVFYNGEMMCVDGEYRTLEQHGKPETPLGQWIWFDTSTSTG